MVLALTLVVDSNVLFSATIKEGDNAGLLLSDRLFLIAPERLFEEFKRYREFLLMKTHRSEEEFEGFLEILAERIKIIPRVEFEPWLEEAKEKSPVDDFPFTALANAYGVPVWSNDRELRESMKTTGFVEVLNTKGVLEKLGLR